MSSKSTIILTEENEHWYKDGSDYIDSDSGESKRTIIMELSKSNVEIICNDSEDLVLRFINPDCELYKIISNIND